MAGKATNKLGYNINSLGDPVDKQFSFVVSGVNKTVDAIGCVSTTSTTLGLGTISSLYGILLKVISCTSTNELLVLLSGQISTTGIKVKNGEYCFFRPQNPNQNITLYSGAQCSFEFSAFGV